MYIKSFMVKEGSFRLGKKDQLKRIVENIEKFKKSKSSSRINLTEASSIQL